ncbi:MAG: GAF domain-containing protein [bacterium]
MALPNNNNLNGRDSAVVIGKLGEQKFPPFAFKTFLTLKPLIDYWNQYDQDGDPLKVAAAQKVREQLRRAPELAGVIEDLSIIEKHRGLVDQLMSLVIPPAYWNDLCAAAIAPFQMRYFYATPQFVEMEIIKDGGFGVGLNLDAELLGMGKILNAYSYILKKLYGIETGFDYPIILTCHDPGTLLPRYFHLRIDARFIEIKHVQPLPELSVEDKRLLLANPRNLEIWKKLLPPEIFEFHGFAVFNAVEITDQEILSSLKNDLLEKDALISPLKFQRLQEKVRALLRRPDLLVGLAGIPGASTLLQQQERKIGQSFILVDRCRYKCSSHAGSIYERALERGENVIIEDLAAYAGRTEVEEQILQEGIKNIFIAPLRHESKVIGLLELGSPHAGDINAVNIFKLREVFNLLGIAIKRSLDELNDRLEAVIKNQCTAIHPSVEWRFRRAALNYLQYQQQNVMAEMESIVFKDVFPLFGVSDIRNSSTQRNEAIRADLLEQLRAAQAIMRMAMQHKKLPFLSKLDFNLQQQVERLEDGLSSGDESTVLDFLHREIEPYFEQLQEFGKDLRPQIEAYRAAVDKQHGVIYRRRKDFDMSVMQLNETISQYIEEEQEAAQKMFPHYFEKYKSDGVEHGMYIGAALVENGKFDTLYLRNLRLWQLMLISGIARRVERIKRQLPVPLEMAHLILVQNIPLSVRFRYDEKKFDVDGAYNVRYEIMKKRIDKAVIKGTRERLTQPGKIAIVYSQPKEAAEYREYLEYLQAAGYMLQHVEEFELEDLQGMHGLHALRVTVKQDEPEAASKALLKETAMDRGVALV